MDRSLLFDAQVIEAAKSYVCIRLATYEDTEEAKYLRSLVRGRTYSGDLENTVFVLLEPDGKTQLSRVDRSPHMIYGSAHRLASSMRKIATRFSVKKRTSEVRVPQMKDFRLALNVSACDGLPLVVGYGKNEKELKDISSQLATLAFTPDLAGKLHFYVTKDKEELGAIQGFAGESGFYLLGANEFGDRANLAECIPLPAKSTTGTAKTDSQRNSKSKPLALRDALFEYTMFLDREQKSHRQHVETGLKAGVDWKTEVPVTDKMSLRAIERANRQRAKNRKD